MQLSTVGLRRVAAFAAAAIVAAGLTAPPSAGAAAARSLGAPNTWIPAGSMHAARSGQTATLLPGGDVLVAGGGSATAELYDPATRAFTPTGPMPVAVTDATATLLPGGDVLVAGGRHGSRQVASAELYDPAGGTWTATGSMHVARSGQTATLLPDGKVLVAGGGCNGQGNGCDAGSFLSNLTSAELYDPATGRWSVTGAMRIGRQFQTATLLSDGKVLVAGGFVSCDDDFCSDTKTAELYDPGTGTWAGTGSMHAAREQQTATLLRTGQVLAAGGLNEGGFSGSGSRYSSAELYNPAAGTWSPTAFMSTTHAGQTATLLANGWVLIAGGNSPVAEIYEPNRALWVSPGQMSTARTDQTATLLPGGHVLVTGGTGPDGQPQATAEVFLAGAGPLVSITPESIAFGGQQVGTSGPPSSYTVSNDGSANLVTAGVEVIGKDPGDFRASTDCGQAPVPPGRTCTVSVRFGPAFTGPRSAVVAASDNAPRSPQPVAVSGFGGGPNAWVPVGPMTTAREGFAATLLPDGDVLIAGGQSGFEASLASAELYDPVTRSFTATGSMHAARAFPAAALLRDGKVLVAGGLESNSAGTLASAELYNPATGRWSRTAPMHAPGYNLTSTLLKDGSVLVTGIPGAGGDTAEVYDPAAATWTDTGPMSPAQFFSTATLLPDGDVLAAGAGTTVAELYDPGTNTWTGTGSLNVARRGQTATLLPDGQVLVAGGFPAAAGNALTSAELYSPATGKWTLTGSMNTGRFGAAATLLPSGLVLMTGGCTGGCPDSRPVVSGAEVYNSGFWDPAAAMTQPRVFHAATLLANGDVLVAGGEATFEGPPSRTAELYTPTLLFAHPSRGAAGQRVTVSGGGFYARETVKLSWDGSQVLARLKTSASGTFAGVVTIPRAAPGQHTLSALGQRSFASAAASFTVTGGS